MKEVINQMIKHPFRTTMIVGGIASGIVSIIQAVKEVKSANKD